MENKYDVIVIGSGHAGVEAALAAARMGCSVLMATMEWTKTAHMSCNPSIGGLGKGHIVKEIDILGGVMGRAADRSCIQFKQLNSSKGPAVRGSRAQCDKNLYSLFIRNFIEKNKEGKNISFISQEAKALILKSKTCSGVITRRGEKIFAQKVILTAGTFMKGMMYIGSEAAPGGRAGEKAVYGLSDQLKNQGFAVHRLKTGTPPRLKKSSIDFSVLSEQKGDLRFRPLSVFSPCKLQLPQQLCHLTYTNEQTHSIIRNSLHKSPLYQGVIKGRGPRYCPSVEDKIVYFPDKTRHQSFLEPETISGESIYLQGLSTSLPADVQLAFLKTIPGLKNVQILRPGYAVEYDFFDPVFLYPTLETKLFKNLFFAGQINGSSGYEEAAGQGLAAGINAAAQIKKLPPFVLKRHEAYMGVLIDDLVTKGTKEPYRMLTSRAEHRLLLREDNAQERLFDYSRQYGLLSSSGLKKISLQLAHRTQLKSALQKAKLKPSKQTLNALKSLNSSPLLKVQSLKKLLCRPEISAAKLKTLKSLAYGLEEGRGLNGFSPTAWEAVEIQVKYEGYIKRQEALIAQLKKLEDVQIENLNYQQIKGLSKEALEKFQQIRPRTLAQAGRISGVPPSALQAVLMHLKIQKTKTPLLKKNLF